MRIRTIAIAGLAGAAAAYLFDPVAGNARRRRIREQITGLARRLAMPERTPPLPVNMVSTPTTEAVADTPEVPTKAEVADTPEVPTKAEVADTPEVPTKAELADAPEVPTKAEVADAPQERPRIIADIPGERTQGYLTDIREDRPMDDAAIASLVRTKVLGRSDLDTGNLVVDVVQGVAFLRGDLKDRRQVDEVVNLTGAVPGVQEVKDMIHLPESPTESGQTAAHLGDAWNG
jgi:BON domain